MTSFLVFPYREIFVFLYCTYFLGSFSFFFNKGEDGVMFEKTDIYSLREIQHFSIMYYSSKCYKDEIKLSCSQTLLIPMCYIFVFERKY